MEPLKLRGAPGSPYTRKMLALLRYRRIPHAVLWGDPPADYPVPKVGLLPTFYFKKPDGTLEAVVDSTPITRRLERDYAGRSAIPEDPALGFLNYLIEDFGDEWLTKAMFHYRWAFKPDIEHAGPLLIYWRDPTVNGEDAEALAQIISKRQVSRLYVVGSNETTGPLIEDSYHRTLIILDDLLPRHGYVLGRRPSSADFALYGQLTQLTTVDPTPVRESARLRPRIRSWVERVDDLSGLEPGPNDWIGTEADFLALCPLLTEIGRVYVPVLLANAEAIAAGRPDFSTEIEGKPWTQPAFPYQAKCLTWLRQEFAALPPSARGQVMELLQGTGCDVLFA